ncbi:transmembrane protein 62-like isoform X2 [Cimex lectularius]|uniref:Calcineurin-like phosphoesterase domain-containing protein n=1 Tax=Cimex lectularius TaxID=79782 RepID=A0A8I6TKL6_CIMLE|nr:transmembrane protein 62-like isoform X2 [Cimex lectularius]
MKLTKGGLLVVVGIVVLSAFLANVAQLIAIEAAEGEERRFDGRPEDVSIGDSADNVVWFVQISDLHLSIFQDPDRTIEFRDFCEKTLEIIKPPVVLATGDLTDAKSKDNVGSRQFEAEWKKYNEILTGCSQLKETTWLDIRGNHDNFDVPGISSERNYFRKYSMQGKHHPRSYEYKLVKGNVTYSFIGIDACPNQGLKRPFNFIGLLQEKDLQEIRRLAVLANSSDYTIWFGHYPTSCIWSHPPGVKSIISSVKGSLAYVCGHFHSLLGFVPKMYTIQKQGFYELELADWKDNRMFRVMAIDHGLFSFVDEKYNDWPVILITNPKHAQFQLFSKEPLRSTSTSTHIREDFGFLSQHGAVRHGEDRRK